MLSLLLTVLGDRCVSASLGSPEKFRKQFDEPLLPRCGALRLQFEGAQPVRDGSGVLASPDSSWGTLSRSSLSRTLPS